MPPSHYWGGVISVNAQEVPTADGVYYILNVGTDKFLSRGMTWGARACVDDFGTPVKLIADGTKFQLKGIDNQAYYGDDYWMYADATGDRVRSFTLTLEGEAYKITGDVGDMYAYVKEDGDKYAVAGNATIGDNCQDENHLHWKFLTQAQRDEYIASKVTKQESAVATSAGYTVTTTLAEFVNNVKTFAKVNVDDVPTMGNWTWENEPKRKGNFDDKTGSWEVFQGCGTLTTQMTGLKKGVYLVTLPAFSRVESNATCSQNYKDGYKNISYSYIEANGNKVQIADWASDRTADNAPDGPAAGLELFNAGKYSNKVFAYVGDNGTLDIAIHHPAYAGNSWFLVGQATVTYYTEDFPDNTDMTGAIVNADCNTDFTGWTHEGTNGNNQMLGNSAFEYWGWNANNTSHFDYYQTITGIPNGRYTISANMYNDQTHAGFEFSPCFGVYGKTAARQVSKAVDHAGTEYAWYETEEISVTDGTLRIGVKNLVDLLNTRWCVVDAFKLNLVHQYTAQELEDIKLSYTINAVDAQGNTIKEISNDRCFDGTAVYYPHAIEKDGTWYLTTANTYAATITENNQVVNITYVANPDVVYYSEGEGSHAKQQTPANPANYSMGNMVNNMASNAGNARDRGLTVCNLSAGEYMFTAKVVGTNKRAVNLRSGSTIITSLDTQTEGVKSSIFTLTEDKTNLIVNGANNGDTKSLQMQDVDYFYITRVDREHLEKVLIKNADCANNDGWPGNGRTTETMVAYDGKSRTVFSSNTGVDSSTKGGQRSQAITLPYDGAYKLTTYCKIDNATGFVAMWVDDAGNLVDYEKASTMEADANGWVKNVIYFTANEGDSKTIYMNISMISGNYNNRAFVSGVELAYVGDASATMKCNEGKYGTFVAPFDVTIPDGVTAYSAEVNGDKVSLTKIGSETLAAGTPVIIKATADVNETFYGVSTVSANPEVGCLVGLLTDLAVPKGAYVLQTQDGVQAFYKLGQDAIGAVNRCYVTINSSNAKFAISIADEEATANDVVEVETVKVLPVKFFKNNQLVIMKNGKQYNAAGAEK